MGRIAFLGTPSVAVPVLRALASACAVEAVFCNQDKPQGRGRHVEAPPVKQAAQALGVGKVFVHLIGATENTYQQLSLVYPSLLAAPDPCADESLMKTLDCVLIGCGLGQSQASLDCFTKVLHQSKTYRFPLVIDADALNLLAVHRDRLSLLEAKDVITPHPLEAARLLGSTVREVEANRFLAGRQLSQRYGCVSLLKGPGSVISPAPTQGTSQWVAPLGSPALAIGGSGDVLAGMIASLMAQSYECSIAAGIGVYLHAQTASKWSEMSGAHCALMVEHLPKLVNEYIAC